MLWFNEPETWQANGRTIIIQTAGMRGWVKVRGRVVCMGHYYYDEVVGDFEVRAQVIPQFQSHFDQAGLMVWVEDRSWVKLSLELSHAQPYVSWAAGRTGRFSDRLPLLGASSVWLRLIRRGIWYSFAMSRNGDEYESLYDATLTKRRAAKVGVQVSSPMADHFTTRFEDFEVRQLTATRQSR